MMSSPRCNIVIMGVSCFDGMASSTRVRNLFEPLISKNLITVNNLVYQSDNREPIGKSGSRNNINFKVIGFSLKNIFSIFGFWVGGISFLRKSRFPGSKNIVYNYNYPDLKNILFILYARLIGYKVIFDIVEDNRYEMHVSFINRVRLSTSRFLFSISRYFTDAYVAISEHLYSRIKKISKEKKPVELIPITVNLSYFKNNNYRSDNNELKIFYGGSFGEKDGLEYLISAFGEVSKADKGIKLILTGAGLSKDLNRIKAKIGHTANKDRIIYKGFLSTEEYYSTLNGCDIFCMTRINSKFANAGFPFKLGEFLASGKAVIATKVGDVSNYLINDVNALLISPDSASELAMAIMEIVYNPEKIKILGAEARKTAESNFDSEKVGLKLLSIFESV